MSIKRDWCLPPFTCTLFIALAIGNGAVACTLPSDLSLTPMNHEMFTRILKESDTKSMNGTQMIFNGSLMDCKKGRFKGQSVDICSGSDKPGKTKIITSNSIFSNEGIEVTLVPQRQSITSKCTYHDPSSNLYLFLISRSITWRIKGTMQQVVTIDNEIQGFVDSSRVDF
jgi:hypothetical protein